jgi:hypothetical protein
LTPLQADGVLKNHNKESLPIVDGADLRAKFKSYLPYAPKI